MAERIRIQNLLRLTLCRKGKAVAKHPLLRDGVIETVKASQFGTDSKEAGSPLWETPASGDSLTRYRNGQWG